MKLSGVTERIKRLFRKETELSRKQIVKKENRIKDGQRFSVFKICLIVFLILYTFSFFGMFFWAIYNSVKSPLSFEIDPWGFPKTMLRHFMKSETYRCKARRETLRWDFGECS